MGDSWGKKSGACQRTEVGKATTSLWSSVSRDPLDRVSLQVCISFVPLWGQEQKRFLLGAFVHAAGPYLSL